jgi:N6-adenosine-specific RNA methylase IME4
MGYHTIVADPPWKERTIGRWKVAKHQVADALPYPTMPLDDIRALPVGEMAEEGAHLWLWTTNSHLEAAFSVMRAWGFTYLTTITWVKPSGFGAYFASTTQHCLFGYYQRCRFPLRRWAPTHFASSVKRHSQKPEAFYKLVEEVSPGPRLELFARQQRPDWDVWGNEVESSVRFALRA